MSNDVMNGAPAELARSRYRYGEDGVESVLRQVTLLHQAFELRAAAEPDAVVLVVGEERITCGELDARANRLARFLVEQGVGPEVRVAICAERAAEMVVAMYAVLKAGGAYVPVDPAYPEARQADILADSGALLLLTQERLAGRIPTTSARPVFLDRDRPRIELYGTEPLPPLADERNLAYVIYTSGSTGRPKGVAIAHRSAVVLTRWAAADLLAAGARGRPGGDLDLLRHVDFRAVRDARAGRHGDSGRQRPEPAGPAGSRGGDAGQHRPVRRRRAGAVGRHPAVGAHHQSRRRGAAERAGRAALRAGVRPEGLQPLRPFGGHHLLDLGADRGGGPAAPVDRPPARRQPGDTCSTATSNAVPAASPASCIWPARGCPVATWAGRT